ncbi:serine O-acetyltransferase [Methylocystis parvus]|uniref:Serine acetyltransferase n=1 Tax=Methylocystis parvus TaxID=134 RepID=A0A6B8M9Q8_9HYPH|nr:serine O-acetyltransferase [Methylocystis parvus]QGM98013.1 serine O-acetyltransferase [Methylocystis parvus]WBK01671.1 serine O-acetyltransferase [Methylocystis parvus OBBP]
MSPERPAEELCALCAQSDAMWAHMRQEAQDALRLDPTLAPLFIGELLNRHSLEEAVIHRVSGRLGASAMDAASIADAFLDALASEPEIGEAFRADAAAYVERDPACRRLMEPLLYFKGYHAIQASRLAHALWRKGKRDFAFYIQSRTSDALAADIHPAARFGKGVFLDHATGFVVGETAVVEDDVSILHGVTLGGTGKVAGDRHPKVRRGVMIGAGTKILGNIEIGAYSRIAAGSVVLHAAPPHSVVAGVPAKIVGVEPKSEPARDMDQILRGLAYDSFDYVI